MGTKPDMKHREVTARVDDQPHRYNIERAWQFIFKKGARIDGKHVRDLLGPQSLVPTRVSVSPTFHHTLSSHHPQNAFSERFFRFSFNFFMLFVVDLLHEFELGVWKAIFTHLMRILFAAGGSAVQDLNWR